MEEESVNSDSEFIPPELIAAANEIMKNTLPEKSKKIYRKTFNEFFKWMAENKTKSYSEIVLLAYFNKISKTMAPSTLWSKYLMIKSLLSLEKNVDISKYAKLIALIKNANTGATVKKAKFFKPCELIKFINEAPDEYYLAYKVVLILGITGACRRDDLTKLTIDNIKREGSLYLCNLLDTKTHITRSFAIECHYCGILEKYINLRPPNLNITKFFLTYRNGKCLKQSMGKNAIGSIPQKIATWLGLPNAKDYTGHSFRRSSVTILADAGTNITDLKQHGGWKSTSVAEGYIDNSIEKERKIANCIAQTIKQD